MAKIMLGMLAVCISLSVSAQTNRIDIVRHDAPELARFGEYDIGVRTLELTDPNHPDVLNTTAGGETVHYDRTLVVDVWYPAQLEEDQEPGSIYRTSTRNTAVTATLHGRAVRDATILSGTSSSFLSGMVDADNTGVVGYSMGGYGLVINLGGGYSDKLAAHETAGYEDGTRAIYENATNSDRYLLTYVNAGHSAGAPIPLPVEVLDSDGQTDANTYWKGFDQGTARGLLLEHLGSAE